MGKKKERRTSFWRGKQAYIGFSEWSVHGSDFSTVDTRGQVGQEFLALVPCSLQPSGVSCQMRVDGWMPVDLRLHDPEVDCLP